MRLFDDVSSLVADVHLRRAVSLAQRARGATAPNPMVGCVVVRDGEVVGEGFHPAAGSPHAEVFALRQAGDRARGADVYVTLEPCAHHGRTPPCVDALVAAGVNRVVIGMADPTAQGGGGAKRLESAGISVEWTDDETPFRDLNEGWLNRAATGRPLVVAKVALSLDGAPALRPAERASISGPSGAKVTRTLRSRCDAVVVGAATVVSDDPALTVRDVAGAVARQQPLRVVLARETVPPQTSRVFTDGIAPTLVLASEPNRERATPDRIGDAPVVTYDGARGVVAAVEALGAHGINEVLIEPGPRLLSSLWEASAIDYLVTVVAGGMAGPCAPPAYVGSPDADGSELCRPMAAVEAGIVGDVAVTLWRPAVDHADS